MAERTADQLCCQETDHGRRCRVARCSHADSAIESRSLSFKSAESKGLKNETGLMTYDEIP